MSKFATIRAEKLITSATMMIAAVRYMQNNYTTSVFCCLSYVKFYKSFNVYKHGCENCFYYIKDKFARAKLVYA